MIYSASLDGSTATLSVTGINNRANIKVHNAADLGSQLLAFATDPHTPAVDTPSYQIDAWDTGLRISNATGSFVIPWRWITTVGNALSA